MDSSLSLAAGKLLRLLNKVSLVESWVELVLRGWRCLAVYSGQELFQREKSFFHFILLLFLFFFLSSQQQLYTTLQILLHSFFKCFSTSPLFQVECLTFHYHQESKSLLRKSIVVIKIAWLKQKVYKVV